MDHSMTLGAEVGMWAALASGVGRRKNELGCPLREMGMILHLQPEEPAGWGIGGKSYEIESH